MDIEVAADVADAEELSYPRDLLRRFAGTSCSERSPRTSPESAAVPASASRDMDLSLGLSLGGCFAVEPMENRLVRSSSVSAFSMISNDKDVAPSAFPLARTCSLPVEVEEEQRKRKEMQSLKRMEAKRKRSEKRNSTVGVGGRPAAVPERPPGLRRSSSDLDGGASRGYEIRLPVLNSNIADVGNCSSLRSSSSPEAVHKSAALLLRSLGSLGEDDEAVKRMSGGSVNGLKMVDMMEEMPCVSTKGDGPNGRRIEGFLYKYRKGEEVRIVCVCHGSFLTPAEFVKHAGGGEVDHPLRHIVVNPSPSAYY